MENAVNAYFELKHSSAALRKVGVSPSLLVSESKAEATVTSRKCSLVNMCECILNKLALTCLIGRRLLEGHSLGKGMVSL